MAKKILYKVTAYHCPRCGGVTEPTKKYCDFCGRDLKLRRENHINRARMLIDCGNYVFFDEIKRVDTVITPSTLEVTTLEDTRRRFIRGTNVNRELTVTFLSNTERGRELFALPLSGIHKIRFEMLESDLGYEQECYIGNVERKINGSDLITETINFIGVNEMIVGNAIPQKVLDEFRCPNCGAPILSRYGACDYCSGWNEVEF